MGNQLAAAATVNLADVSSSLELIAPLGGEGRNFLTSMYCWRVVADGDGGSEAAAREARLRLRGGGVLAQPQQRVRRHRQRLRDKLPSGPAIRTTAPAASREGEVQEAFHFTGELRTRYEHYMQILLHRSAYILAAAGGGDGSAAQRQAPAAPLSPRSTVVGAGSSYRAAIVVKVFVRNSADEPQQRFLQRMQTLMRAMTEQLAAVDATLPRRGEGRGVLFYTCMDTQDTRFAMLQRPYIVHSLPERLALRPYYEPLDRLFVCYQLLRALVMLHEVYGVVHGDLKANNVMLQSNGWLYLVDLAPFKPARLPLDNPALFDYYYDTDDTRYCSLAPEKFSEEPWLTRHGPSATARAGDGSASHATTANATHTSSAADEDDVTSNVNLRGHTAAMDVFSAGCVMAHVLTDEPLFRLSEVLELRGMTTGGTPAEDEADAHVASVLRQRGVVPVQALPMLCDALRVSPAMRPSARELLAKYTPAVFPRSFCVLYDDVLPPLLASSADVQIQLLSSQLPDLVARCAVTPPSDAAPAGSQAAAAAEGAPGEASVTMTECLQHTVRVLVPIVLQAIRFAQSDESTYRGVLCLDACVPWCAMSTLAEVLLPHVLYLVNDITRYQSNTTVLALRLACRIARRVVRRTMGTVTTVALAGRRPRATLSSEIRNSATTRGSATRRETGGVDSDPRATLTLFDDLMLPCVGELLRCASVLETSVLVELALQLPRLLCLARRCLEWRQLGGCGSTGPSGKAHALRGSDGQGGAEAYGVQLQTLLSNGWDMLQVLYSHQSPHVVAAALRDTRRVASFLGLERSQDDLVPQLTTAIAAAVPVQRVLFAEAIAVHESLLRQYAADGRSSSSPSAATLMKTVQLFLDEGLRRGDTTCVSGTLHAFAHLVLQGCCTAEAVMPLVHHALPMLLSPFRAIRLAACRVVEAAARSYCAGEVMAYLLYAVRPLLTRAVPLAQLSSFVPAALRPELMTRATTTTTPLLLAAASSTETVYDSSNLSPSSQPLLDLSSLAAAHAAALTRRRAGQTRWRHGVAALRVPLQAAQSVRTSDGVIAACNAAVLRDASLQGSTAAEQTTTSAAWSLSYRPTSREARRVALRALSDRGVALGRIGDAATQLTSRESNGRHVPASSLASSAAALHDVYGGGDDVAGGQSGALEPMAMPLCSRAAHMGAIYACCAPTTGHLLSAGARAEAVLWAVEPEVGAGLQLVQRVPPLPGAATRQAYTVARLLPNAAHVLLGSSVGTSRLLDLATNTVLHEWQSVAAEEAAVTAAVPLSEQVMLLSNAVGTLDAVDLRGNGSGSVWHARIDPACSDGVPRCLVPLYYDAGGGGDREVDKVGRAYGVVVGTATGSALLYDLRFQRCVQRYRLPRRDADAAQVVADVLQTGGDAPAEMPDSVAMDVTDVAYAAVGSERGHVRPAILCACLAPPCHETSPSVLLGAGDGCAYRIHLASGRMTLVLQPASYGAKAAAVRAMLTQRAAGVVFTAGEDRHIRRWSLHTPAESHTMYRAPFVSPSYEAVTTSGLAGGSGRRAVPPWSTLVTIREVVTVSTRPAVQSLFAAQGGDASLPPPCHHSDAILALTAVQTSSGRAAHLVSASRDGVLTVWRQRGQR